jgi:branched-subunit amino acid aminotransferase/4-amino-4-deoxychorismate lyase
VPFVQIGRPRKAGAGPERRCEPRAAHSARLPGTDTVKNYHWLDLVTGPYDAYDRGGETVILTDHADNVVERPGINVFAVG